MMRPWSIWPFVVGWWYEGNKKKNGLFISKIMSSNLKISRRRAPMRVVFACFESAVAKHELWYLVRPARAI